MNWQKQSDEPLFPDIIWSRPETKHGSGKLLIIGGNSHAIAAPVQAYGFAEDAGAGAIRVVMPDSVQKSFGTLLKEGYFTASNPSGGFGKHALSDWLSHSAWADGVLLAGNFGHNSETSSLIETYCSKYPGAITITHDAIDCTYEFALRLLMRSQTMLVMSFAQAQRFATAAKIKKPLQFSMGLIQIVESLEELTLHNEAGIVIRHADLLYVAQKGRVVTNKAPDKNVWRVETATHAAVWWLQNQTKPLEAVTTALYELTH